MRKTIAIWAMAALLLPWAPASAQDSPQAGATAPSETAADARPTIVKTIIRERVRVVRDTIVVQSDSQLVAAMGAIDQRVDQLKQQTEAQIAQQQRSAGTQQATLYIVVALLLGLLAMGALLLRRLSAIAAAPAAEATAAPVPAVTEPVAPAQPASPQGGIEGMGAHSSPQGGTEGGSERGSEAVPEVGPKPTLEAYNAAVHEFTTLNDHINALRQREARALTKGLYRYLALQTSDKAALLAEIRRTNIADDKKEQYVALVSMVENFLRHKRPVIDAWLHAEPSDGVDSYATAIRMPLGQPVDPERDSDVLGDDIAGQTVAQVHKMGYHFPGNTIKPFLEKSIVSV